MTKQPVVPSTTAPTQEELKKQLEEVLRAAAQAQKSAPVTQKDVKDKGTGK